MTTYDDYTPRYHVGDRVTANAGLGHEREATVANRRVYRSRAKGPNTYYTLNDGTHAWEASLTTAYERVSPEIAMSRIVASFGERLSYAELTTYRQRNGGWKVHVHLEVTTTRGQRLDRTGQACERIDLYADAYATREVETTTAWSYVIGDGNELTAANLGDAIVTTYNATLGTTEGDDDR